MVDRYGLLDKVSGCFQFSLSRIQLIDHGITVDY